MILANRLRSGPGDNDSQGLLIGGAPCMINIYSNVIEGGSSPNGSIGLYLTAAAVNVENNLIVGGSNAIATGMAVFLFGVTARSSSPTISFSAEQLTRQAASSWQAREARRVSFITRL